MAKRILVVDDDAGVLATIAHILGRTGYEITSAASAAQGFRLACREPFDLMISDLVMPDGDGLNLIRKLKLHCPRMTVIAISGGVKLGTKDALAAAKDAGADIVLGKPFALESLLSAVTKAFADPAE